MPTAGVPIYDCDLFDDDALRNPYDHYRVLRDLGPVVWLSTHGFYAVSRYDDIKSALRDHRTFSSASGVAANEKTNQLTLGTLIASDPPEHDRLRQIVGAPLFPRELAKIKDRIEQLAKNLVDELVLRRSFDAAADLAHVLPLKIVSELVGLPEDGRQNMLKWAAGTFNILGVENERCAAGRLITQEMRDSVTTLATEDRVRPGGWIDRLYAAANRGEFNKDRCPILMRDYLGPALDTTIFATTNLIWLFGKHPEQWEALCADPALIPSAINEAVRIESPVRGFTRTLTIDHRIGDATLPANSRIMFFYASGNRDERKWEDPGKFDIRRKNSDHLGFGHGIHTCAGMHLAKLEITALLNELVKSVSRFELGTREPELNNMLRGFKRLDVTIH